MPDAVHAAVPRIDELLSRAVAEQVAEQRGQREAFEDIAHRLQLLENAIGQGMADLSGSDEEAGRHLAAIEGALDDRRAEIDSLKGELQAVREETGRLVEEMGQSLSERLDEIDPLRDALVSLREETGRLVEEMGQSLSERLDEIDPLKDALVALREETGRLAEEMVQSLSESLAEEGAQVEELGHRLDAMDAGLDERLMNLGEALITDLRQRFIALDHGLSQRLSRLEGAVSAEDMEMRRLAALEQRLGHRLTRLEEKLAGGEIEKQVAALEEGLGQRMSTLESAVRGGETDWRLVALEMSMAQRLARLESAVRPGDTERRLASLEEAMASSMAELRATVGRLQEVTVTGLDDLREASEAAEVGILERIVAEAQVVGARFEAVRPIVDVMAQTHPELEVAMTELRRLAATTGPLPETNEVVIEVGDADPFAAAEGAAEGSEIFLPPEETPIPEHRIRSLPRRKR